MTPSQRATVTALLISFSTLAGCSTEDSLRIGTFNAQFLPSLASGQLPGDDVRRPQRISERIVASGYDIIALNEVFDEDSREVFVDALAPAYPHYVEYLGDDAVGSEDSGLMLFSKFPFVALSKKDFLAEPDDVDSRNGATDWKEVGFVEFDASFLPDAMSAKGAGLVRVQNPNTGRIYTIVFSHMQASYPEEENVGLCPGTDRRGDEPVSDREKAEQTWLQVIDLRRSQLDDIRRLIEGSLTVAEQHTDDIFVLGDLNIDGDQADPNLGATRCCQPNLHEWVERFNTAGQFTTDSVKDAWTNEHPGGDRGLTNLFHWALKKGEEHCAEFEPETGARLDYFLRNRPTESRRRLVVQHMTRAFNLREGPPYMEGGLGTGGIHDLSDHIGVNADLNVWAPFCNPLEASANPKLDTYIPGQITYPGSMQWFRLDAPGTYAFVLPTPGVEYRVYGPTELSVPASQYFEETITFTVKTLRHEEEVVGKKFHLPDPPLYVRVVRPLRTSTGNYSVAFHKAACSSMNEACSLAANHPEDYTLPPTPVNADDTFWFELHLEKATSGALQELLFFAESTPSTDFELELRAEDGVTVLAGAAAGGPRVEMPFGEVGPGKRYLLLKRKNLALTTVRVGWETNLTIFHGVQVGVPGAATLNVYCHEETDTVGTDEIYLTVIADGATIVNDVWLGDFDDTVQRTLEDVVPTIRYVQSMVVRLRDEDSGANGGDDIMEVTIPTLSRTQFEQLCETRGLSCCGGSYSIRFNRSRSLNVRAP